MSTPDNNSLIIYSTDPDAGTVLAQVYVFYGLGLSNPQARFMYYAFLGDPNYSTYSEILLDVWNPNSPPTSPIEDHVYIYSTDSDAGTNPPQVYILYGLGLSNPQARYMYYAFF